MGRTLKWWRLAGTRVGRDRVAVIADFTMAGLGGVSCPAAPLVAATVERWKHEVRYGYRVTLSNDVTGEAVVHAVTWHNGSGQVVGLAAAADREDPRLVAVAKRAIEVWAGTLRTRRVQLADVEPLCAGARRERAEIDRTARASGEPVYVLGRPAVEHDAPAGPGEAVSVDAVDRVPAGSTLVFPATGASPQARAEATARGLRLVDATCPLVASAHAELRRFAAGGDTVVLVGNATHAAADGFADQAPANVVRIESAAEAAQLAVADPDRVAFAVQTGTPLEEAAPVVSALRSRWSIRGPHPTGWCYAASDRAGTVRAAAAGCDLVVVLGDAASADTRHLAKLAGRECARVHAIGSIAELLPAWLADASTVGIAMSLSSPAALLDATLAALSGLGPVGVVRRQVRSYPYLPS